MHVMITVLKFMSCNANAQFFTSLETFRETGYLQWAEHIISGGFGSKSFSTFLPSRHMT